MSAAFDPAEDAVRHLSALIRFDTVNPPGNERPAADYVVEVGQAAGLEAWVVESLPGRGNAIVRLPGRGAGRPIVLLSHLDTVPCEPTRWSHSPWSGAIADDCVWGRGAIDSKLTTATQLAALIAIARSGARPDRDVILAATASEELGGPANGAAFLAQHHRALVDGEYVLSEHGGFAIKIGERVYHTIQTAEKGGCSADLVARGSPGHASVPHDDNPIHKLARALDRLAQHPMPYRVTDTLRAFVERVAADQAAHGAPDVAATVRALLEPGRQAAVLARLPIDDGLRRTLDATMRNTAAPTMLAAGSRRNVIPSEAVVQLSGRPLPGVDGATFRGELQRAVGPEVEIVAEEFTPALERSLDDRFETAALRALRRHDPEAVVVPFMMPLGTDAKRMIHLNVPIYGFVPMLHEPALDYMSLCHGHDERSSLRSIHFGARVLRDLIADLAGVGAD